MTQAEVSELVDELVSLNALESHEATAGCPIPAGASEAGDMSSVDVMEVFSPPRFTAAAPKFGLKPGIAVDLSTCRPSDGIGWDLLRPGDQAELDRIIEHDEPQLLTGSPRCDPFSVLQWLNKGRVPQEKIDRSLHEGRVGLKVACRAYKKQYDAGRFFLHEHPTYASSWKESCVAELLKLPDVYYAQWPMCRFDMKP